MRVCSLSMVKSSGNGRIIPSESHLPKDYDFEAHKNNVLVWPGDVPTTYADASALERDFGFTPKNTLREGLRKFTEWYKEYYQ